MAQRALVTGGAGFIGSHVADVFLANGWDVTIVDDLSRGTRSNVPAGAAFIEADVRSPAAKQVAVTGRFDVLCLQAAQIDVRHSVTNPANDADINLLGLINMLRGAAEGDIGRVVFASSGGVLYGEADTVPTPETASKRPISPYGVSKLGGEHYLRCLAGLHGFEWAALRYANVFGPRQDPKGEAGVVSIFVDRARRNAPLTIFGAGTQTRDYVYVRDVARANVLAATAELPSAAEHDDLAYNVGTSREISVRELADIVTRVARSRSPIEFEPPRDGELARSALDASRARSQLGWEPRYSFEQGFDELLAWFDEVQS